MKRFFKYTLTFVLLVVAGLIAIAVVVPYNKNGFLRMYAIKMQRVSAPDRQPSIVLLGGSNVAFGYDSEVIERTTGKPTINAGLQMGLGLKYMIDDCFPRLKRGDILVFSPEYIHFFDDHAYGEAPLTDVLFLNDFSSASMLNWKQWRTVINNFPNLLHEKLKYAAINASGLPSDPVYKLSGFNKYGDVVAHWTLNDKQYSAKLKPQSLGTVNSEIFEYMKVRLDELRNRGVTVVVYPAVISSTAFENSRADILTTDSIFKQIGYPNACPLSEVVYPDSSFYDTSHHLKHYGAIRHSEHLAKIIRNR